MKMTATIELEFESAGETTHNAMDAALIRGLEALKKGIELTERHVSEKQSRHVYLHAACLILGEHLASRICWLIYQGRKLVSDESSRVASICKLTRLVSSPGSHTGASAYRHQTKPRPSRGFLSSEHQITSRVEANRTGGCCHILDRCSMSFFQPPSLNSLEPYQLEFLESIFKQPWSQIVPRHCPLAPDLRQHLQTEISARLCSFVARGVMERKCAARPDGSHGKISSPQGSPRGI